MGELSNSRWVWSPLHILPFRPWTPCPRTVRLPCWMQPWASARAWSTRAFPVAVHALEEAVPGSGTTGVPRALTSGQAAQPLTGGHTAPFVLLSAGRQPAQLGVGTRETRCPSAGSSASDNSATEKSGAKPATQCRGCGCGHLPKGPRPPRAGRGSSRDPNTG